MGGEVNAAVWQKTLGKGSGERENGIETFECTDSAHAIVCLAFPS